MFGREGLHKLHREGSEQQQPNQNTCTRPMFALSQSLASEHVILARGDTAGCSKKANERQVLKAMLQRDRLASQQVDVQRHSSEPNPSHLTCTAVTSPCLLLLATPRAAGCFAGSNCSSAARRVSAASPSSNAARSAARTTESSRVARLAATNCCTAPGGSGTSL